MDDSTIEAYLRRITITRPRILDATALADLHRAHQMTVPFENLSIHLAEPISLAPQDLIDKIVTRRRGGFCYELNGAFALLLRALGARVDLVSAQVYGADGRLGPPLDHLALIVWAVDGSGPWLADVGFGSHSVYPLPLRPGTEHADPAGRFTLAEAEAPAGDIDVLRDGSPQYRVERRARALADFVPTCWWHQTSPGSHFTRGTVCSRLTEDGRISLSGRTLIRATGATRTEVPLADDAAVLAGYRDHFGLVLDRVPTRPD